MTKLTKKEVKKAHKLAKKMKSHRKIKKPYALATYTVKRRRKK